VSEVSVSLSFLLNQPTKCPNKLLMRLLRPLRPLPHGRDKRRIFAFPMWLRPPCMIRVVPGTFCQGSIIIIYACNRKYAGREAVAAALPTALASAGTGDCKAGML
jgi:hypothetical protein